ncbi:MAG: MarR family transcriptional regulator, partial [Caldilinea sp.]
MPQSLITQRYAADIAGVLNCYDRIVISGQLAPICYAKGITKYLYVQGIRIFDYTKFAEPLRDAIRQNAAAIAAAAGIEIEFITKHKSFRKEDRIQAIVQARGAHPGLVHIFSAMETC